MCVVLNIVFHLMLMMYDKLYIDSRHRAPLRTR